MPLKLVTVVHKYSDNYVDKDKWENVDAGATTRAMTVRCHTGSLTTGRCVCICQVLPGPASKAEAEMLIASHVYMYAMYVHGCTWLRYQHAAGFWA